MNELQAGVGLTLAVFAQPTTLFQPSERALASLLKIIKTPGRFPSDDAATKLVWPALFNITADRGGRPRIGRRP